MLIDSKDETRWLAVEKWESVEANQAYLAWRGTPEGKTVGLGPLSPVPPA